MGQQSDTSEALEPVEGDVDEDLAGGDKGKAPALEGEAGDFVRAVMSNHSPTSDQDQAGSSPRSFHKRAHQKEASLQGNV